MKLIWKLIKKIGRFITGTLWVLITIIALLIFIPLNMIQGISPKETIDSVKFAWEIGKDEDEES